MREVILVGGFSEIIELCDLAQVKIVGIIDNCLQKKIIGIKILGNDQDAKRIYEEFKNVPLIIAPDKPERRNYLVKMYTEIGFKFSELISPHANISNSAKLGKGCIIQSAVNISSNVRIGCFVKLNTMSNIMHDSLIGDYSTIAPNAVILGKVTIESFAYIGANSTILPEKKIGSNSIIGAGSVITKDVDKRQVIVGNPGILLKKI